MSYMYMEHPFLMFLDHTQRLSTVGRTPLDERSARRRDLYLTTHDTHDRQISMPPVRFEPKILDLALVDVVSKSRKFLLLWILVCVLIPWPCLGLSACYIASIISLQVVYFKIFVSRYCPMPSCHHKQLVGHTVCLVAICSVTVNYIPAVLHVTLVTVCLSNYHGFIRCR